MIRKFWLHGNTGFFVRGEISSYAVVVLSIATAWALVRVWLRVNQYMASYFTSSGDTSARCAVIWVRFPFDVISKQPAVEHKIRGSARGQSQHHDLLAATGDRNGFWVGLN